jgi:hypothetical protein
VSNSLLGKTLVAPRIAVSPLWRDHGPFLAVLGSSMGALILLGQSAPLWHLPSLALSLFVLADLVGLALLYTRIRTRLPWWEAWTHARRGVLASERLLGLAVAILGVRWLLLSAVAWKASIPTLHPFAYDVQLHALDTALHGGMPWTRFGLLLGPDAGMRALDLFYRIWYPALSLMVVWIGWQRGAFRRRFFLSLALLWTVGSVLAVLVSSAGPVYLERLTGDASYAPLITRLSALELPARTIQEALWGVDGRGSADVIAGIAAFPSLHVAVPALFVCAFPRWRFVWIPFTAVTLIGSILLGWHYLIDGYAGVALAWASWRVAR